MADEASIIANPTSTPAAVSTGYQAQNTRFIAQANGLDCSVVEGGVGQVTVKISGPVDVNGVLYAITVDKILAIGGGAGRYVIYLDGAGNTLTPTLEAVNVIGTFDPSKNARYTAGGKRILNWVIFYDDAIATIKKWSHPKDNIGLITNGHIKTLMGIIPTSYIYGSNILGNLIFDAISPYIPNNNDVIKINGSIKNRASERAHIVSHAVRGSVGHIYLYSLLFELDLGTVLTNALDITDGDLVNQYMCSLSW
jgi:hypothetical protein